MSARPLNETVPRTLSFLVRPETASSRVVLPLPEGPITASTWAGWRLDLSWGLELAGWGWGCGLGVGLRAEVPLG
eukprot:scaffold23456_cov49-Phaeocystis_antarctica.AAC.3